MPAVSNDDWLHTVSDAIGRYVLPVCSVFLPWPLAFRVLWHYAGNKRLFRTPAQAAWVVAAEHRQRIDEATWKRRFCLLRMIDQADIYLTLTRSSRWWRKYVDISGDWPEPAATCIFLTYHWGAGHWIWPILRARGLRAFFLARRPTQQTQRETLRARCYKAFRIRALQRIGGLGMILTGNSAGTIANTLRSGNGVVGMLDLPASPRQQAADVTMLGGTARLPVGLLSLASEVSRQVVLFSCGIDFASGRRSIQVETLPHTASREVILGRYAEHLQKRLREAPEAWHMWHEARLIFPDGFDG